MSRSAYSSAVVPWIFTYALGSQEWFTQSSAPPDSPMYRSGPIWRASVSAVVSA